MTTALQAYITACQEHEVPWVSEFVEALSSGLTECYLSERLVALDDRDAICLATALCQPHSIKLLDLEGNRFGPRGARLLFEALAVGSNRTLREVRLGRNVIGDEGAMSIGQTLALHDTGLRVLDLSHNDITTKGCVELFRGIPFRTELSELSVYGNLLSEDAASVIVNVVQKSHIRHLHLGFNALRDSGAALIARSLAFARDLATLDLSGNHIGRAGAAAIADALKNSSCIIQRLNLRHNDLDDESYRRIAEALRHTQSLTQLFLAFNPQPSRPVAQELLAALASNTSLQLFDVLGWPADEIGLHDALPVLTRQNSTLRTLLVSRGKGVGHLPASTRFYVGDDEEAGTAAVAKDQFPEAPELLSSRLGDSPVQVDDEEELDRLTAAVMKIPTNERALRDALIELIRAVAQRRCQCVRANRVTNTASAANTAARPSRLDPAHESPRQSPAIPAAFAAEPNNATPRDAPGTQAPPSTTPPRAKAGQAAPGPTTAETATSNKGTPRDAPSSSRGPAGGHSTGVSSPNTATPPRAEAVVPPATSSTAADEDAPPQVRVTADRSEPEHRPAAFRRMSNDLGPRSTADTPRGAPRQLASTSTQPSDSLEVPLASTASERSKSPMRSPARHDAPAASPKPALARTRDLPSATRPADVAPAKPDAPRRAGGAHDANAAVAPIHRTAPGAQ
jgi:hypothetical protein